MNIVTYTKFPNEQNDDHPGQTVTGSGIDEPHLAIQVLSVIAFGVFSIVAVSLAFAAFWVAGLIATVLIAWTWAGSRMFGGRQKGRYAHVRQSVSDLAPPVLEPRSSGNASFDAYRSQTLERLERESRDFDDFLERLREARGASEFDKYMDDRATAAKRLRDHEMDEADAAKED